MTAEAIAKEMAKDIRADIYGDISGHEWWAEEIFRLREANYRLKQHIEDIFKIENALIRSQLPSIY